MVLPGEVLGSLEVVGPVNQVEQQEGEGEQKPGDASFLALISLGIPCHIWKFEKLSIHLQSSSV